MMYRNPCGLIRGMKAPIGGREKRNAVSRSGAQPPSPQMAQSILPTGLIGARTNPYRVDGLTLGSEAAYGTPIYQQYRSRGNAVGAPDSPCSRRAVTTAR
jgi:hypothetical protein